MTPIEGKKKELFNANKQKICELVKKVEIFNLKI
jgi:hypothetical protein